MRLTCVLTVSSVTTSRLAISVLDRPSAISRITSVSRGVSPPSAGGCPAAAAPGTPATTAAAPGTAAPTAAAPGTAAFPGRGRRPANSAMSLRVTDGASRASPAAITRTASNSRSAVTSLSRNPLAPARSAS